MHRKASPIFHDGGKILRLSDLSAAQAQLFSGWIDPSKFVILGEKNDFDCVNYEDYEHWWKHHYSTEKDLDILI